MKESYSGDIPLYISRSTQTTEINKTGTWRFSRPVYEEKTAPCGASCPAGEDIAKIEMLASQGRFKQAWETILLENPFPSVCGRVCFHPCEKACNRGEFDSPVAIHHLERFLGDTALDENAVSGFRNLPSTSKKIAIAGAGPAGLAAAYFMARLGHQCVVFEAGPEPGGLLRAGIPEYRLPPDVLNKEIRRIESAGVEIICETPLDRSFMQEARNRFDALFVGCGHGLSLKLHIEGEEHANDGLALLKRIRQGSRRLYPGRIAVVGGGNTAVDVARSLLRLGGSPIVVYRRERLDMPAFPEEIEAALQEGVELMELAAPVRYEKEGDEIVLTLQKMKVLNEYVYGRRRVVPVENETERMKVDYVFTAIGGQAEAQWSLPIDDASKRLEFPHCTVFDIGIPAAFGGDLTNPVKSVTDAIASGKAAAICFDSIFRNGWDSVEKNLHACRVGPGPALSMEIYLGEFRKNKNSDLVPFSDINIDYFEKAPRNRTRKAIFGEHENAFAETERTYLSKAALAESSRCFNCGICNECGNCSIFCPEIAVEVEGGRKINLDYCKGCGICVVECPRNAMALKEETS